MRNILFISVILLTTNILDARDGYKRNPDVDIIHYEFSVAVSDTNNIIYGHTLISVRFKGDLNTIDFDLRNITPDGKGMKVRNLTFDKVPVKWTHKGDKLIITMDDPVKAGSDGLFTIDYSGIPADG